tara:strand:+ start:435 stop:662 length:228 start_codon:yes stop_codon:yes gene_type:complete
MNKKTANQYLLNYVNKLDKINDIEFEFEGNIKEIIKDPIKWAESQANRIVKDNIDKYLESKALGKEFWDGIEDRN